MKRNEMLAKIDNLLCKDLLMPRKEPDGSWDSYALAQDILSMMENAGIQPPEYKNFNPDHFERVLASENDWCIDNGKWYLVSRQWEQE